MHKYIHHQLSTGRKGNTLLHQRIKIPLPRSKTKEKNPSMKSFLSNNKAGTKENQRGESYLSLHVSVSKPTKWLSDKNIDSLSILLTQKSEAEGNWLTGRQKPGRCIRRVCTQTPSSCWWRSCLESSSTVCALQCEVVGCMVSHNKQPGDNCTTF